MTHSFPTRPSSDLHLCFTEKDVLGIQALPLSGRFSASEMFDRLLRGTGFAYRDTNADTVRVFRSGGALGDASIGQEIIVTGTRIGRNGEKTTAPVVALDKQDLEDAGAQDLSETLAEQIGRAHV